MSTKKQAQIEKQDKVTFEVFTDRYRYDPETGHFYDKRPVDRPDCSHGYRKISVIINNKRHYVKAHRAAFLCMTGKWPENYVDHINLDKGDNRWKNLREATHQENLANIKKYKSNTSGYKCVHLRKEDGKFASYIGHDKKRIHLGLFNTAQEAYDAYCKKAIELRGKFFRGS